MTELFDQLKGYSLGLEVIKLQEKRYDMGMAKVGGHTSQIELWTEQQKHINALYAKLLNAKKEGHETIDFSSPEDRVYVDRVNEIMPDLFPPGDTKWSKEHVTHLTDGITAHVESIASSSEYREYADSIGENRPDAYRVAVYKWSKDHVSVLTEGLNAQLKTLETSMGIRMTFCNHDMQELTELIKAFHEMNKRESDHVAHII